MFFKDLDRTGRRGFTTSRNTPYKKKRILELLGFLKSSQFTQLIISFYITL